MLGFHENKSLQNGKYIIEKIIGKGRFSVTYRAKKYDGKLCIIKILDPEILIGLNNLDQERLQTMFWQEASKLSRCDGNPNIVKIGTPFKENEIICLPMEYIDGNSLADRSHKKIPEKTALEYIHQIGKAVSFVHKKELVHCDIRPANIFLRILQDRTVEPVLADFGLALDFDSTLTSTRKNERTDGFSAPELYSRSQKIGPYTDVYSLAATLYELITGDVPPSAEKRKENEGYLESPKTKNIEISDRTNSAILKGMEIDFKKRPQSIESWMSILKIENLSLKKTRQPINHPLLQTLIAAAALILTLITIISPSALKSNFFNQEKPHNISK